MTSENSQPVETGVVVVVNFDTAPQPDTIAEPGFEGADVLPFETRHQRAVDQRRRVAEQLAELSLESLVLSPDQESALRRWQVFVDSSSGEIRSQARRKLLEGVKQGTMSRTLYYMLINNSSGH